jgi:hypothetical protein
LAAYATIALVSQAIEGAKQDMRLPIITVLFAAACTGEANHLGNPLLLPFSGLSTALDNTAYNARRGKVEVFVKSNFPMLIQDITAGGGATLSEAFNLSGVPVTDRPARRIQLRSDLGIYQSAPGALVTALMVYGG